MEDSEKFAEIFEYLSKFPDTSIENGLLLESNITYYQLRQFITLVYNNTDNKSLKSELIGMLKVLAKLEVKNVPIPSIKKLKTASPEIFPSE